MPEVCPNCNQPVDTQWAPDFRWRWPCRPCGLLQCVGQGSTEFRRQDRTRSTPGESDGKDEGTQRRRIGETGRCVRRPRTLAFSYTATLARSQTALPSSPQRVEAVEELGFEPGFLFPLIVGADFRSRLRPMPGRFRVLRLFVSGSYPGSGGNWYGRRYGGELGQAPEVLGGGGQQKLVPCPGQAPQPEPRQPQVAFCVAK